jgi:fatty-acyl-CoA synthase
MYIGDYLARRCVYTPEKTAVVDVAISQRFTYRELNDRANRLASWLRSIGVEKGDRVAMLAFDGIHFYDAFFACGKLGAIFVPLNWRLHGREIEQQLRQTTPKLLIHSLEEPMHTIIAQVQSWVNMPQLLPLASDDRFDWRKAMTSASNALSSVKRCAKRTPRACSSPAAPPASPKRRK